MSNFKNPKEVITTGNAILGIEFGSTRIKSVLIDDDYKVIASGDYTWASTLNGDIWTYSKEEIIKGLQESYANATKDAKDNYGCDIINIKSMCISAMMHGYLAFDKEDNLLVPFRTWQCTNTGYASKTLSKEFNFNIPLRWSVSHYYQAILNKEDHVDNVDKLNTLAGWISYLLTDKYAIGIGDASGMFPIDSNTLTYDSYMLSKFKKLSGHNIEDVLPKVLCAGEKAGNLTENGAALLDVSGKLQAGTIVAPAEGDAGTGMVATNAVAKRTGNISAGTSIFSMVVLEKQLAKAHEEIDMVTTPDGSPVGMVHCNNCTRDLNDWVNMFNQVCGLFDKKVDTGELYTKLFNIAMQGQTDCNGLCNINYVAGEPITGFVNGVPMLARDGSKPLELSDFMRSSLYSAIATLAIGNKILIEEENVSVDKMTGHGGYFKTPNVGQQIMADALNVDIACMETAAEGGAWGAAVLADFASSKTESNQNCTLGEYLDTNVFKDAKINIVKPTNEGVEGFENYLKIYKKCLEAERVLI